MGKHGIFCTVRTEMGSDVNGACGQLACVNDSKKGGATVDIEDLIISDAKREQQQQQQSSKNHGRKLRSRRRRERAKEREEEGVKSLKKDVNENNTDVRQSLLHADGLGKANDS